MESAMRAYRIQMLTGSVTEAAGGWASMRGNNKERSCPTKR